MTLRICDNDVCPTCGAYWERDGTCSNGHYPMPKDTYSTFAALVDAARAQGATHVTFSNWHSGAFWKHEAVNAFPCILPDLDGLHLAEIMNEFGFGPRYSKRITAMAHFYDGNRADFTDWYTPGWIQNPGIELNSQFIPIEKAVEYYHQWNYCLKKE